MIYDTFVILDINNVQHHPKRLSKTCVDMYSVLHVVTTNVPSLTYGLARHIIKTTMNQRHLANLHVYKKEYKATLWILNFWSVHVMLINSHGLTFVSPKRTLGNMCHWHIFYVACADENVPSMAYGPTKHIIKRTMIQRHHPNLHVYKKERESNLRSSRHFYFLEKVWACCLLLVVAIFIWLMPHSANVLELIKTRWCQYPLPMSIHQMCLLNMFIDKVTTTHLYDD